MLIGNIKNSKDLQVKRDLQKSLLELEVANEQETQKRIQEKGIRDLEPKKLPEQYKTNAEILEDRVALEKKALDNFIDLGFNYTEAGQLTNWVSNENELAAFNSGYKGIKKEINENFNKSVVNADFIKNYLNNYFEDVKVNLGKKFSKEYERSSTSFSTLEGIKNYYPSQKDITTLSEETLNNIIRILTVIVSNLNPIPVRFYDYVAKIELINELLFRFKSIIPDDDIYNQANSVLTQNDRAILAKSLSKAFIVSKAPSKSEFNELAERISESLADLQLSVEGLGKEQGDYLFLTNSPQKPDSLILKELDFRLTKLLGLLSDVGDKNTGRAFVNFNRELASRLENKPNFENFREELDTIEKQIIANFLRPVYNQIEDQMTLRRQANEPVTLKRGEVDRGITYREAEAEKKFAKEQNILQSNSIYTYIDQLIDFCKGFVPKTKAFKALAKLIIDKFINKGVSDKKQPYIDTQQNIFLSSLLLKKGVISDFQIGRLKIILQDIITKYKKDFPDYDPRFLQKDFKPLLIEGQEIESFSTDPYATPYPNKLFGLGTSDKYLKKLKKHFKGDEALLNKVVKTLQEDSSSSDEGEQKELNRHIKATSKADKKLEKLVGGRTALEDLTKGAYAVKDYLGLGFNAKKIPVKKVGKGVKLEKEDNPTYRQFGKYVLHIPYLLNNNTANFKYPSLGSIPSIKPLKISDDYKELLLETLQTGKLNKKELDRLPQSEIKHFEKVAVGAGLVEQLGLKIGTTEEDKADAKRFELLRGEYHAGNNNDKLIKELRQLITKFITNGRIHKNEGLNLLLELSTL
jgi:hypothetical protein